MDTKPDTIKVSASHREEIFASHANLYVTVKGSSIVSGNEAMKKTREVNQLVEALTSFGLSPDAIHLQGVRLESTSGTLLKSSSAVYHLKVRTEKLDQLPGLLDIIAEQKNASLDRIEWKYPEDEAREQGLDAAIAKGKAKAEKVAAAMGVSPGGAILIHGIGYVRGGVTEEEARSDWTEGCIAVTNAEIDEIWAAVDDGTPIDIRP